jgi:hypothetical protein
VEALFEGHQSDAPPGPQYTRSLPNHQIVAVCRDIDAASAEAQTLAAEVTALQKAKSTTATLAGKERLLTTRLERLKTLQQRLGRIEQAQANHDLVASEQERLVEQVKLIRADLNAAYAHARQSVRQ